MSDNIYFSVLARCARAGVFVAGALALPLSQAATVWTGPNTTWTKSATTPSDTILAGKVVLTRGTRDVMFNTAAGEAIAGLTSPADTMWAFGDISNFATLTYQTLASLRNGNLAARILNQPMVVHLVAEDIYLSIRFTTWGQFGSGTVAYTRSTPPAPTVWTDPNINWTKSVTTPSDTILAGKVVLTRGTRDVLINTAAGETVAGLASPKDTLWAFGDIGNFASLTYQSLESLRNGNLAARILNQPMVVHLIDENIYLSIRFTTWGQFGSGAVAYTRSTPPVSGGPTVTLTSPSANAIFAAPASVTISANATVGSGTVTNVSFFNQTTLLGSAQANPFRFTANNLAAGAYTLTAVATASGITGTSAVVHITVVLPATVSLTPTNSANGLFSFGYSADPGLTYVIQRSSDLGSANGWVPVVTNVATSNFELFSEDVIPNTSHYYRVGRLPNP